MSKFVNISIMIVISLFIMKLVGIDTGADATLAYFGLGSGSLSMSQFIVALTAIYALAAGAGIIIGFFTKSAFEWAIIAMSAAQLFILYGAFDHIVSTASGLPYWSSSLIYIIFGAIALAYIYSAFEFAFNR